MSRSIVLAMDSLYTWLQDRPVYLALSGGKDSVVLLHALVNAGITVTAVHIHHGLQASADDWAEFCLSLTHSWGVSCEVKRLHLLKQTRKGIEAVAREARYEALWQSVPASGILLTAHHQRDQAETLLLRLLRGAGVSGLAGMRDKRAQDQGRHLVRPLLSTSQEDISYYARTHHLTWVEDPSNEDRRFKRNDIRHRVLPILGEGRPDSVIQTLANTCHHLAEAADLLTIMAQEDWEKLACSERSCALSAWRSLVWIRAKQVLAWRWQHLEGKPLMAAHWEEIQAQFYAPNSVDKQPQFAWHGHYLMMGANRLWFLTEAHLAEIAILSLSSVEQPWGIWAKLSPICETDVQPLTGAYWRMRQQGDEVITPFGRKRLKDWLQTQYHFAPWQKQRWPVLCNPHHQVIGWANMPSAWGGLAMSQLVLNE